MERKSLTIREKIEKSKIKVNPHYDVSAIDIAELCESEETSIEVANVAFHYGYYQGVKAAKAEMSKSATNGLRDSAIEAIVKDIEWYKNEAFAGCVLIPSAEISFAYQLDIIDHADYRRLRGLLEEAKKVNAERTEK